MALNQSNHSGGQITRVADYDICVVTDVQRAAKRHLSGSSTELESVVKQEKLDSSYDQAMLNRTGSLLGTIVSTHPVNLPRPVSVLTSCAASSLRNSQPSRGKGGRTRKLGDARSNKSGNVGIVVGRNNRILNRPVVLLPHGGAALPRQGPVPVLVPRQPSASPTVVELPRRGLTTASAPGFTSSPVSPVVVLVSQPSAPRPRIVKTTFTSPAPSSAVTSTTVRRANGIGVGSGALDRLKAIIGKSILEKYVGPCEPPSELYMPARCKHICQGCGDEFVTTVGLVDHVSRRSLVISFHCTCHLSEWPQLFYNPCMFESFYRLHCVRPGVHASRESVVISALELDTPEYRSCLEARNRQKRIASEIEVGQSPENANSPESVTPAAGSNLGHHCVHATAPVKEIFVNLEVMPNEDGHMVPPENAAKSAATAVVKKLGKNCVVKPMDTAKSRSSVKKGKPQSKLAADSSLSAKVADFLSALLHNRTKCRECSAVYKTRRWLKAHFSVYCTKRNSCKQSVQCTECGLSLPTTCSLRAHQRMHENRPPFVCPQCGIVFDEAESVDVFRAHVERHCFHLTQWSSSPATSNCPRCTFSLPDGDIAKMAQHLVEAHATVYYKCRSCPKAFSNAAVAERHSENTGHDTQKDIVRKCPSCDGVFKERTGIEIQSHVMEHLSTSETPEFHCPLCTQRASLQSEVVDHMRLCHPDEILPSSTCEVCGQPHAGQEELFTHVSTKHVSYFESVMKCLPSVVDKKSASGLTGESGSTTDSAEETACVSESEVRSSTSSTELSNTTSFTSPQPASVLESETGNSPSSAEVLECTRCQTKFDSVDVYKRHQARHRFLESKKARKKMIAAAKCSDDPLQQVFAFFVLLKVCNALVEPPASDL